MSDDKGYQTIPSLMLKHTDYADLLHGRNDIFTMPEALQMCDALEEVVCVWKEGLDAFGLTTQEASASEALGAVMILKEVARAFMPLSHSYAKTPMLAQWYKTLPVRVAETYNRLRGQR